MRILHLSHDGLPDWRVEKAATSAHNQGHELIFLGRTSKNFKGNIFSKVFGINWTSKALMGLPFYWNSVKKRIRKVVLEVNPDIIHAHNIFSAKIASELKIPFIYDDHEFWSKHSMLLTEINKIASKKKTKHGIIQSFEPFFQIGRAHV